MLAFLSLNLLSSLTIASESLFSFCSTSFIMASTSSLISSGILATLVVVTPFYYRSYRLEMNVKAVSVSSLTSCSIPMVKA